MSASRCYGCGEFDSACRCKTKYDLPVLPEHKEWMSKTVVQETRDSEYVNNIRVARVGDVDAETAYAEKKEKGCCGFVDIVVKHKDGTLYMLGYNYGH